MEIDGCLDEEDNNVRGQSGGGQIPEVIDSVFDLKLKIPKNQCVYLNDVCFWAPSLLWLWRTTGVAIHPHDASFCVTDDVKRSVKKAAINSVSQPSSTSSVQRKKIIRFLLFGEHRMREMDPKDDLEILSADIADIISDTVSPDPSLTESFSLCHFYSDQLGRISEILFSRCLLSDDLISPELAFCELSQSWLWLFDALWNFLVLRNPSMSVEAVLKISSYAINISENDHTIYHPICIVTLFRHLLFIEEFVHRRAIGFPDSVKWYCDSYCYSPSQVKRMKCVRGLEELPLGRRSALYIKHASPAGQLELIDFYYSNIPLFSKHRTKKFPFRRDLQSSSGIVVL